jgi:glutathione-specific gamma-glutamylcyclotransferase
MPTHWVFAYGSLIWKPGFTFIRSTPARLDGYTRKLCVLSHMYRGTPECLGLVFGLDKGEHCEGVAYEVDASVWPETYAYLTARELITNVYHEARLPILLKADSRMVEALTYIVDPQHEQYAGDFSLVEVIAHVQQGHGIGGSCVDYVKNTASHLAELGISDPALDEVVKAL